LQTLEKQLGQGCERWLDGKTIQHCAGFNQSQKPVSKNKKTQQ
jgi:hypothetical protein